MEKFISLTQNTTTLLYLCLCWNDAEAKWSTQRVNDRYEDHLDGQLPVASWGDLLRSVPCLTLRWKLQILSYFYSFQWMSLSVFFNCNIFYIFNLFSPFLSYIECNNTLSSSPQLSSWDTQTLTACIWKWRSSYHFQQLF